MVLVQMRHQEVLHYRLIVFGVQTQQIVLNASMDLVYKQDIVIQQ